MEAPAVGTSVKFHRNHPEGEFDAIVTGYDRQNDHDIDQHGLPDINLVYLDTTKTLVLGGAGWREAFERVYGVPHEDVNDGGPNHYSLSQEGTDEVLQATADEAAKQPSAEDLDAAAAAAEAEAKAKAATSGDKPKARIVKGSKAQ